MTISTPRSRQQAAAEQLWARHGTEGIRVILIDPARPQARPLEADLRALGVQVASFKEPMKAMVALGKAGADVVIASANLGKGTLRLTCKTAREEFDVPVLLAYRSTEVDLIGSAVLAGGRPLLRLPYDATEVLHALADIGPSVHPPLAPFVIGDLTLTPEAHATTIAGQPVDLSPTEFNLLSCLTHNPDRTVTRQSLIDRIWRDSGDPQSALATAIRRLRRKLAAAGIPEAIHTVQGIGYRLESRGCRIDASSVVTRSSISSTIRATTAAVLPTGS